jgi:hypothetical protein
MIDIGIDTRAALGVMVSMFYTSRPHGGLAGRIRDATRKY